jgi:hypothetical protein
MVFISRLGVDFGVKYAIKPTHYTVRYANFTEYSTLPRNWLLQGANDLALLKVLKTTNLAKFISPNKLLLLILRQIPTGLL